MPAPLRTALLQLTVSDDPSANLTATLRRLDEAIAGGARLIVTPEATNILSTDRDHQNAVLQSEGNDPTLAALCEKAAQAGIWLLIGSLALKGDQKFVNRSFLVDPQGQITARYDKIHMFDVEISDSESYRESASYQPGNRAVLAQGPAAIGMTICYDLRFPALFRRLAQAGAQIITVPAAFNPTTGAAHWHTLLRARAIETGCFVLAPAQCGAHPAPHSPGRAPRRSFGHSLAVAPWGEVLADAGEAPGVTLLDLDLTAIAKARSRIPSLSHDREFTGP